MKEKQENQESQIKLDDIQKEDSENCHEDLEGDKKLNIVIKKYDNKIEIILKHNDKSLMQLLVEINKNDNDFDLSIFNNQPNKQQYEFEAKYVIENDTIQSIVNNNADEIKEFIKYILIDALRLNYSCITSSIEGRFNIKIAKCFDINSDDCNENKCKIAKKITDAEIVIQEVRPSEQQPNIQEQSGNIIQNISQWCLQNCCCCCCLNK